ncbi:hypothetical protein [Streptomyces nanshensis]|uniref:Uncharacterized protein n=1 Tax=Streptomyces nanshensis TaxID=518642 RepID=A0A1E7L5B3_9ACTN|nr:hypothetical protein [Streptomyces nanshensis]OEV11348.1 hypothetical protein AN218_13300 [Streptomyces nanshensis]
MLSRRQFTEPAEVRCETCPGRPVLPTPVDIDTRKCVRCQGKNAYLSVPHPEDHLCTPCRRACPTCGGATVRGGGECRSCRRVCRHCGGSLPPPEVEAGGVEWAPERVVYPDAGTRGLCGRCRTAHTSSDPLTVVLAAVPEKLLRACGGQVPARAMEQMRWELQDRTGVQLVERIERRWWGKWAHLPLEKKATDRQEGYGPDDVLGWLVVPTECQGRCEDGFIPDDPNRPCPVCRPTRTRFDHGEAPRAGRRGDRGEDDAEPGPSGDVDERAGSGPWERRYAEAVDYRPPMRECTGRDGACGVPVAEPYEQCPACAGWPWCGCGRRRFDPARAACCPVCAADPRDVP